MLGARYSHTEFDSDSNTEYRNQTQRQNRISRDGEPVSDYETNSDTECSGSVLVSSIQYSDLVSNKVSEALQCSSATPITPSVVTLSQLSVVNSHGVNWMTDLLCHGWQWISLSVYTDDIGIAG